MTLPKNIIQREYDKFVQGGDGYPKTDTQLAGLSTTTSGLISLASAGFAQQIPITPLSGRRSLTIYNSSASPWWVTQSSGASGIGIAVNAGETFSADSYSDIHVVPTSNGQLLTYLEMS